ncbi:MAG: class I tRNA ligase family protein, partial [Candidatus Nanoarchaeia archaeon]
IIEKHGRDFMRYYFAKFSKGEDFSFNEKEMIEIQKFMIVLNNINSFVEQLQDVKSELKIEDKWIISKYNSLLKNAKKSYEEYKFFNVIYEIENFVVMDLSRKYIQMIRERADETKKILNEVRIGLIKLLAPIIPFYSEMIWQELRKQKVVNEESIFLSDWPNYEEKMINLDLEKNFDEMLKIIEKGMAARDAAKIGLKWPLASAQVIMPNPLSKEFSELLKKQLRDMFKD